MSDLNFDDVAADAEEMKAIPQEQKLKNLSTYAYELVEIDQEIADLEDKLKARKEALREVSERKIPEIMNELAIDEFKLKNGLKVRVNPYYSAKITDPAAYDWLEEHDHGSIIKGEFILYHRRDEVERLEAFKKLAESMGFNFEVKVHVHPMTLKAFVKEQIESGVPIPRDLFNVYTGFKTKISLK
jgi:hypothetical protein